ncbi:hypothetical protein niasHS_014782 [Heterodera schachtii]|uniref:Uncharacterized protein n=1 Tax=Heterodera schachtii TaxID=97005 RepID=A0ABD2IN69_HETSC
MPPTSWPNAFVSTANEVNERRIVPTQSSSTSSRNRGRHRRVASSPAAPIISSGASPSSSAPLFGHRRPPPSPWPSSPSSSPRFPPFSRVSAHNRLLPLPLLLLILPMAFSSLLIHSANALHHRHEHPQKCSIEGEICTTINAHVCRNGTCVSACTLRGMKECHCDVEEDNFCFLCCGSANDRCLPAHEHGILRDNGERWERDPCKWCRTQGTEREGMACDDKDPQRLCLHGKCSKSVCANKVQGEYCDRKEEKICVDDICENPCARIAPHLMVCDCPAIDPDTGFASEDRCQLCCHDYTQKPISRRCQNAFRKYQLKSAQERPIWRIGLECAGGKRCNRYGICSNDAQLGDNGRRTPALLIAVAFFVFAMVAVIGTTAETF